MDEGRWREAGGRVGWEEEREERGWEGGDKKEPRDHDDARKCFERAKLAQKKKEHVGLYDCLRKPYMPWVRTLNPKP
jgi:hypothetical protein